MIHVLRRRAIAYPRIYSRRAVSPLLSVSRDGHRRRPHLSLRIDESTGEPYLQLPPPYAHIVLTPQRLSDAAVSVKHMNDPRVYMFITGPPLPYLEEHALAWIRTCTEESESALAQLRAGAQFVDGCPVRVIRDISNCTIAEAPLIGDCGFGRHGFGELEKTSPVEAKQLEEANMTKKTGDPSITWTIGDYMDPAYAGQGIMSAVVRTLIEQWAMPRMNAHRIIVSALMGNRGSVRVFEKCGFTTLPDVPDVVQMVEAKGGARTGLHMLEWRRAGLND